MAMLNNQRVSEYEKIWKVKKNILYYEWDDFSYCQT